MMRRRLKPLPPLPRKTNREIAIMREAGRIVAQVHAVLAEAVEPGISTWELDRLAADTMAQRRARSAFLGYHEFPAHICVSINEELVHGIPDRKRKLKKGDIVSIDVGVCYRDYIGDSAWTYAVGDVSDQAAHLMDVTRDSLLLGIKAARPGNRLSDVSRAVQQHVESHELHLARQYTGHGVGRQMHERPQVLNYEVKWEDVPKQQPQNLLKRQAWQQMRQHYMALWQEGQQKLPVGLVFALEPMVQIGTPRSRVLQDQWTVISQDRSLTAHFEHTIAIMPDGARILTKL